MDDKKATVFGLPILIQHACRIRYGSKVRNRVWSRCNDNTVVLQGGSGSIVRLRDSHAVGVARQFVQAFFLAQKVRASETKLTRHKAGSVVNMHHNL